MKYEIKICELDSNDVYEKTLYMQKVEGDESIVDQIAKTVSNYNSMRISKNGKELRGNQYTALILDEMVDMPDEM